MADLKDSIRLTTVADLQALSELVNEYKKLGLSISGVAGASRIVSEQIKRDALEQANATKQATLQTQLSTAELNKQSAELRKNNLELKAQAAALNESKKSTDSLFGSLSAITGLRSQLIGLFGAMSVGAFAQEMVDAQSKVESFQLSMKNLLGAEYGGKLVADLKQFTVNTPLNFEEVIKATNQLVGSFKAAGASSKTIGTEIPQILDSLGNSAAALGGDGRLGRLIYAFSQVQATGRLMGTEVRQITETGFPLLAVMSQTTGKSVQELQKDITDGKVSFEQFKTAILSAGKEGGVFAGSMDIMANTVRGRIDKMKESVFFALANIGNSFTDSAKKAIDFGANIVQALFGTESATKRTIELLRTAIVTWGAYTVATRIAASQTVIGTAIDRVALLVRGQMALANIALTGSTESLTFAQLRAAAAARSFNAVAMTNPLGLLALAIGAVVAGYQLYNSSVEQAEENQKKLSNEIATAVAPIQRQKQEFNNLANAVLATNIPLSEQEKALKKLKEQYPTLLKGVSDLSTAEDILNKNKIKTNTTLDFRNTKFEELKKKYPEQLKGIDTLVEAEAKLGGIVRLTNRDFAILSATMENNIRIQTQVAGANENFAKKIQAQADLARLRAGQTGANLVDFGGNIIDNTPAIIAAKEKEIAAYDKAAKEFVKASEVIRAKNEELTGKLKYSWEEIPKTIEKTGKEGKEKALKYQTDTAKQTAILNQANLLREQQETRENQQKILDLEREYAELRVINAKGSQSKKVKALSDIDKKYNEDSANLTRIWNEKEAKENEESLKAINLVRSKYRASHIQDEEKAAKSAIDLLKKKYDLEIDSIMKSKTSNADKMIQLGKLLLIEDLQITNAEESLDLIKKADKARGEAAKNIAKLSKDIISDMERQNKFDLEELDNKEKLLAVNNRLHKDISGFLTKLSPQLSSLLEYNDTLKASSDANQVLAEKTAFLNETILKTGRTSQESFKATKEANEANQKAVQASNDAQMASYGLLLKAVEFVFSSIKKAVQDNINLINKAYQESNRIYQQFVVEQRKADTKAYKDDLDYRLKLYSNNFEKQLSVLKEYLDKSEDLINNQNIADEYASEFKILLEEAAESTSVFQKVIQDTSLNAIETYKNAITRILNDFGDAHDGLSKEQEIAFRKIIDNADRVIEKLEWQRDNTVDILDRTIDVYRDKYEQQTKIVKDETDKQIDAINKGLSANLDKLGSFYDAQGDVIRTKYGDILDNNVRYTDDAFEKQLAIWNKSRTEQEGILRSGRDSSIAILKSQYESGTISLDEYLSKSSTINSDYQTAILAIRTKFYDELEAKTKAYNESEAAELKKKLDEGILSETEYNAKLEILDDIKKQRSKDIKSIVTKDRDDELAYLKTFYYNAKVFEEQKAADAIVKINEEAATKLQAITASSNAIILNLENQKRKTILSYNSQIFEENRRLALAQAELAKAEAKAAAWRNPFTARGTIRDIEAAFAVILSQIANAVNPFAGQLLEQNVLDNQVPVNTGDGNPAPFARGTDNLSASMSGTPKQGKTGGWIIEAHEGEAIFSKPNMDEMTRFLGKRPTRDEVIDRFKMGTKLIDSNSFVQKISPYVISKTEGNVNIDLQGLRSDLSKLTREVVKRQQPIVNIDKNGIRTYLTNINSQIEIKNQKFSS